jgi:hypothetical protein
MLSPLDDLFLNSNLNFRAIHVYIGNLHLVPMAQFFFFLQIDIRTYTNTCATQISPLDSSFSLRTPLKNRLLEAALRRLFSVMNVVVVFYGKIHDLSTNQKHNRIYETFPRRACSRVTTHRATVRCGPLPARPTRARMVACRSSGASSRLRYCS